MNIDNARGLKASLLENVTANFAEASAQRHGVDLRRPDPGCSRRAQGRPVNVSNMAELSPLDRARAAKARAHAVFSKLGNVVGVGITTIGSEFGLKINLASAPKSRKLPTEVDGVPVRVEIVGRIRKQADK